MRTPHNTSTTHKTRRARDRPDPYRNCQRSRARHQSRLQSELADSEVTFAAGCAVDDTQRSGLPDAIRAAHAADVAILIVGDQAGLFGRGTVGEGCDRDNLDLPGVQRHLVEAVLATGTPVVLVLVTGRPYAVSWALQRCAAVVQAFFPGEEGAAAIAGVISGRVNPSGRLPVTLPRSAGAQPYSYLHPPLGGPTTVSNLPTAPGLPFGHGLSYTTFEHADLAIAGDVEAGGSFVTTVRVTNTGPRAGTDVVQLYGHDVVASITQPTAQLLGYRRLVLEPGESAVVRFVVPTADSPGSSSRIGISCAWSSRGTSSCGSVPHARRVRPRRVCGSPAKPTRSRSTILAGPRPSSCRPDRPLVWSLGELNPWASSGAACCGLARGARRRPVGPGQVRARPVVTSPVLPGRSQAGLPTGGSSWRRQTRAEGGNRHCGERRRACVDRPTPRRRHRARCEAVGAGTAALGMAGAVLRRGSGSVGALEGDGDASERRSGHGSDESRILSTPRVEPRRR